ATLDGRWLGFLAALALALVAWFVVNLVLRLFLRPEGGEEGAHPFREKVGLWTTAAGGVLFLVGAVLVLTGGWRFGERPVNGRMLSALGTFGVVLGAWYLLTLVLYVFFGPVREPPVHGGHRADDLGGREVIALAPIALLCLALGVYPKPFFDAIKPDVRVV